MLDRVNQLETFERAYRAAMELYRASRSWPKEERYTLTDQVRRSSRAVCANMAEAWAKRAYPRHFASKVTAAHGEAEETLTWIRFAERCGYLDAADADRLAARYRQINAGLIRMGATKDQWCPPASIRLGPHA
ncbi:four helix bundle protein [Rubrivirga sp. IMCC45206]|uniref:four helix bundle protein n=1 Tax=Rubrivirga sp. IMCC45206 TaxID=3391614 RepID=UPI00398FABA9